MKNTTHAKVCEEQGLEIVERITSKTTLEANEYYALMVVDNTHPDSPHIIGRDNFRVIHEVQPVTFAPQRTRDQKTTEQAHKTQYWNILEKLMDELGVEGEAGLNDCVDELYEYLETAVNASHESNTV